MTTRFILFLLITLLTGCAPSLFELASIEENYEYYQGRQIISKEDSNAVVFLNFEEQRDTYFLLYVEAVNKTAQPYNLNPTGIYMEILEPAVGENIEHRRFYALDPERQIERLDEDMKDLETSHAVAQGLHGLFAVFEVVSDIAADDGEEAVYDAAKWGTVIHAEEIDHEIETGQLENAKYYWQNEVLRKTTLYKDERFGGIIYVPFDKNAELVEIIIPFGTEDYRFLFEQREID